METVDLEQGTQDWKDARAGFASASGIHNILSKPRKRGESESAGRKNYKAKIICEILSGKPTKEEEVETWWMKRGKELEGDARSEYEMINGVMVQTCGFVHHPLIQRYGCSPDGLVGSDGMVQIKCLNRANHMDCWTRGIPNDKQQQMTSELSVCREGSAVGHRIWNDFVSYHPDFPPHLRLYVKRIWRKDVVAEIEKMEAAVAEFNGEVDEIISHLPQKEAR
jgi:hypothetical protein